MELRHSMNMGDMDPCGSESKLDEIQCTDTYFIFLFYLNIFSDAYPNNQLKHLNIQCLTLIQDWVTEVTVPGGKPRSLPDNILQLILRDSKALLGHMDIQSFQQLLGLLPKNNPQLIYFLTADFDK